MAAITNYLEDKLLDHVFKNTAFTQPSGLFLALYTAAPSDTGGGTEVSGGSYARKSLSFAASSGGSIATDAVADFGTATANWGTITHVAVLDAVTSGNFLWHGALTASKTVNDGDTFKVASGSLTCTLT